MNAAYFGLFQSNTTSGVYSTAAPVPTSGRNNTNSSNTMLPPGFTATADPHARHQARHHARHETRHRSPGQTSKRPELRGELRR